MHALLALLLVAAPTPASRIKALYEELPELALPLEFKSGGMPDRPKVSPENVAALKAALRARVEHGDRAFLEAMAEDPAPNASPPITLEFWVFGRVTMAGSAAILCELYRNEGEGGPDDVLDSQVYLITLSPKSGTIIDTRGVYTWSSNEGEQQSRLEASGRINLRRRELGQQEGPPRVTGSPFSLQVRASGVICGASEKRLSRGTFRDPKTKEELTLTTECEDRLSVSYRAGPKKPPMWMVIADQLEKGTVKAQFMNSLATYELTPSDSQVSCKNPNGTVQAFEKVP